MMVGFADHERIGRSRAHGPCRIGIDRGHVRKRDRLFKALRAAPPFASGTAANARVARFHLNAAELGDFAEEPIERFKNEVVKRRIGGAALVLLLASAAPDEGFDHGASVILLRDCFGVFLEKFI